MKNYPWHSKVLVSLKYVQVIQLSWNSAIKQKQVSKLLFYYYSLGLILCYRNVQSILALSFTIFDLIQSTKGLCELTQKKNVLVYKSDSLKETVELPLNKTTSIVVRLQPHLTIKCGKNEWVIVRASKTEIKYFCAAWLQSSILEIIFELFAKTETEWQRMHYFLATIHLEIRVNPSLVSSISSHSMGKVFSIE